MSRTLKFEFFAVFAMLGLLQLRTRWAARISSNVNPLTHAL